MRGNGRPFAMTSTLMWTLRGQSTSPVGWLPTQCVRDSAVVNAAHEEAPAETLAGAFLADDHLDLTAPTPLSLT